MLVNRDLIHRWLSVIVNSPVPRRPFLVATALTAAGAVAAGAAGPAGVAASDGGVRTRTVSAADAATPQSDRGSATAAPQSDGGTAKARGSGGKNDRDAKIAAAREKAAGKKAAREKTAGKKAAPEKAAPGTAAPGKAAPGKADRPAAKGEHPRGKSVPSARDLMPGGVPGGQSAFQPSAEQVGNAESIVRTGERMKMPPRAQVIAVATALQESKLENLGHLGALNDHDSLGLFQQRPSVGWGTPEQVTDPDYAAEQFYLGLQRVPGYTEMPLTQAAQTVQVSAFPYAYAQWEKMAADLVLAAHGAGPYAGIADGKKN